VDDEESIRDLVLDGLSSRGIIVDSAADPRQALELAAQRPYDAILCDLNLPSSPGPEFIIELQRTNQPGPGRPTLALILMTGDLLASTKIESLRQGGIRVLEKPFQISELVAALREGIGVASAAPPGSVRK
jgi:DNA-binding response OmpR family regulator